MAEFVKVSRNQVRRKPERGRYDKETVYSIIDAALVCHVAFIEDGEPFVIPTLHVRSGDNVILHGSKASRLLKHAEAGNPLSIAFTLVDGLVIARTPNNNSVNYRSVVLFGRGHVVRDDAEKMAVLEKLTEKIWPGLWKNSRLPNQTELNKTTAVVVSIENASAKIRQGGPKDEEADLSLPYWAGWVPVQQSFGEPVPDPLRKGDVPIPEYLRKRLSEQ